MAMRLRTKPDKAAEPFNINDFVWVRLTEFGWKIYDDHHRALGLDPAPYRAIIGLPGGYQRFQLWDLMHIFGPHCVMGLNGGFFDQMGVWFSDPTASRAPDVS